MKMNSKRLKLLTALSALALISACDDNGGSTGWFDWFNSKDDRPSLMIMPTASMDYQRDTQAGTYLAGWYAQNRQDWGAANKYLDKAIAMDPDNIELQQRAMILSMQAGDANRAIVLARKVLEEDNKNVLALIFISVDQIARQEYDPAIKTLSKMPKNDIADFIRPILAAWAGAPEKKVDEEALIAAGPLHAYHALLIADYMGKVKEPERYLVNVLNGGGADAHTLEMMADVYSRQGFTEIANKIYEMLITQYEANAVASPRIKELQAKRKDNSLATKHRIQTPSEGAAEAFYNISRIMFTDQSDDSALVFSRIAQYLDPAKDETKILMARMMVRSKHTKEAIDFYKSIQPGSDAYLEAQRSAAELLEEDGDIDGSIAFLEKAYQSDKDVNALIQIGDVYRRAEKHLDAIKAYDRAEEALGGKVGSDFWHLLYARGMSYERSGNLTKAESDLEGALKFQPNHPYLLNYLGYSWADQGKKLDKALELIAKAAKLKPDDGYIVDSLGWVYYKMGQYNEAAAELEKAVEMVPYDPTINDHLGDAYWRVGRKNEARFQWQRALNHAKENAMKTMLEAKINDGLTNENPKVMEAKTRMEEPVKQ